MLAAVRDSRLMQEAVKLAADGEIGNSDAIRLLQIPHHPDDVKAVLQRYAGQLTREARSKLTLEVFAPLPDNVDNQRYEPIFDRYPITGKTYTTASGAVVPNEIRYYNGRMVQIYGECTNLVAVRQALAGSGYQPVLLRQPRGGATAIAQIWSHQLTDTSLRPYNAMFIIVAAVGDDAPPREACLDADANGASSVLSMFDGALDPAGARYENRARLYYVRLIDSTRVAIEVGRERMGTDKRPGAVEMTRRGAQIAFSITDGAGRGVARIGFVAAEDPAAYLREVAEAAATAGVPLVERPPGTEYVYPGVARIGSGPVVHWTWRTDLVPRLQPAAPSTLVLDSSSEEGALLAGWGFTPKVLGYIPNVRGAVTGVPEHRPPRHLRVRISQTEAVAVRTTDRPAYK